MSDNSEGTTFLEHIEALRFVLLKSGACFLILCIPAWYFAGDMLQLLLNFAAPENFKLHYFAVMEPFFTLLKITLTTAFAAALPFILYWIWGFIAPGLTGNERKKLLLPLFSMFFLALGGAAIAIFFILPTLISFSLSFAGNSLEPVLGIGEFVSMIITIILAAMAMFQFPVILLGLLSTGILDPETVRAKRPCVVVIILVLAALFSPPDVISQLLLAIPAWLLFEAALFIHALRQKKDRSAELR